MWHEARKQEKKIRGMMVDYKRRAERRREYYEKIKQDPAQFLQVHGRPAKIHLDPAVAIAADSPATMMPWQGQPDNLIDRFDVRAHLDIIPEYKPPADTPKVSYDEDDRKTCYERYRTLVQNDFLGVNEDKFLHQIFMEERFGIFKPSCEEEKKRLADKKAAIGYVYEDSTESPPHVNKVSEEDDDNEDKEEDDLSDLDLDVTVDVSALTPSQCAEMNAHSLKYGMVDDDFITYLLQDKEEAEQLRLAREIEEEKAMYSGRKSRRERRALREKKLAGRKITSPPSYAARDSPTYTPMRHSTSKSRSRSPPDAGKIMFITSFGDEGSDAEQRSKVPDKTSNSTSRHGKTSLFKNKDNSSSNVIGPQLPSKNGDGEKISSKNSISSDSSRSPSHSKRKESKSYRSHSYRSRKKSRSRSRSSSISSKKSSRSKSKKHKRRSPSRSRSRSRSVSRSRSRSRSYARSRSIKTKSRSKSKSRSRSRSRSKSSAPKTNLEKSASPQLPPPPIKSYYRHSLSRSNSEFSDDSEEDKSSNKSSTQNSLPTTSRLQLLMGKAPPATKPMSAPRDMKKTKLTPQERLKRKMQLQLKKQYKADKKAQMEKTEKLLQERQDRAEELREMAIKLRQRERERRHRMRGYGYDSDSDTTWTRNPDYNPRSSDSHRSRRNDRSSSRSDSSVSSDHHSPSRSHSNRRRSRTKSPPRSSRRSPVHDRRKSPSYRSSRRSPSRRSPRRSPHRNYRRSPIRSSYDSRDSRRNSPHRRSSSRSPSHRYSSRHSKHNYSRSRSKSPVARTYSSKPLVDY